MSSSLTLQQRTGKIDGSRRESSRAEYERGGKDVGVAAGDDKVQRKVFHCQKLIVMLL